MKKLHKELDDLQKEHEALLTKQKTAYEEMVKNIDEINIKATNFQKSRDLKRMLKFIPVIKKQKTSSEFSQYLFPIFYECEIDANYLQNYFGYVEKMPEKKIQFLEKKKRKNRYVQNRILHDQ